MHDDLTPTAALRVAVLAAFAAAAAPATAQVATHYDARELAGTQGSAYPTGLAPDGTIVGRDHGGTDTPASAHGLLARSFTQVTTFQAPSPYVATTPAAIASNRWTAGLAETSSRQRAFRRSPDGTIDVLHTSYLAITEATGVNASGLTVGLWKDEPTDNPRGFTWDGQTVTFLSGPGYRSIEPCCINDVGQVAGTADDGTRMRAVVSSANGGPFVTLPSQPGNLYYQDWGNAMNATGSVAGDCGLPDDGRHACRWDAGIVTDLDPASTVGQSSGLAINARGDIVGTFWDGTRSHAAAFGPSGPVDLETVTSLPAGVRLEMAVGVDEQGRIAVRGRDVHGVRSFLLTPGANR